MPEERLRDHVHGGTFFRDEGDGETVVLIHGVGLDHTMWDAQVAALTGKFRVIRYDMLGHGKSAHPPDERRLGDFINQLDQLLMNMNIPAAMLVGFSMGGLIAKVFAARYPEKVTRLVLMNTVHRRTDEQQAAIMTRYKMSEAGQLQELADAAVERWFSKAFQDSNPQAVAQVRDRLLRNDTQGYLKAYKVFANSGEESDTLAADIRCPTLAMTGELDIGSTPEMAEAMASEIADAQSAVIRGQRHMAPVEDPDAVNSVLLPFLMA
jgi:pimeloyl-ACP methyl ester carboxylesterase